MIQLHLEIADDVVDRLEQCMNAKKICHSLYGVGDEFILSVLRAIRKKEQSLKIEMKKDLSK